MTPAQLKWLQIVIDIVDYELQHTHDDQLLTHSCHRWVERHPIAARTFIVSAGALLTMHLARLVDEQYDVVSRSFWSQNRLQVSRIRYIKILRFAPPRQMAT